MKNNRAIATPAFSELKGQHKAKQLLARSLRTQRLAHAYLFRGPEGVGKQLFARSLAASVNCATPALQTGEACGVCPSCRKYRSGNHPDFVVVSPEKGTIKIEQIRELGRSLAYPPYESAMRVVLLEDIHTMRQEAANSLLKTLEEPPENNILILTAESSKTVLTTLVSRCQVVPFYTLSQEETVAILRAEDEQLDAEAACLLARLSEGSPGRALLLKKTAMIDILKTATTLLVQRNTNEGVAVSKMLQLAEEMAGLKENIVPLFGLLRIWIRDLLMELTLPEPSADGSLATQYGEGASKRWNSAQLFDKLTALDRAEEALQRNCNRTLVCEVLLFQLQ